MSDTPATDAAASLSPTAQAVLMTAILVVRVDRELDDHELARLRTMMYLSPLFKNVEHVDEVILAVWRRLGALGESQALRLIGETLPEKLRPTAYAWAAEMAQADGRVVGEEHELLARLRGALGLHGELAGKIKAVTEILRRGED